MDIFNSNRRLEELMMFGVDWAIYNRHDIEGPIIPFMFLQNGKEQYVRKLMTDGNPMDFAKSVLEKEEKNFEQFIIGFEGYLRDDHGNRVDSIIIQGFDVTQEKGVALGQMFSPKENGAFKKIDKVTFLGNPDLIIERKDNSTPDYSVEEVGFNAVAVGKDNFTSYIAVFVHNNVSVIANTIKRFLRSKFLGEKRLELSGTFELNISEGDVKNVDFLKFLVTNSIDEELASGNVLDWIKETGRTVSIVCKYGDNLIYQATKTASQKSVDNSLNDTPPDYSGFSNAQLDEEFYRIVSIPNARTNITALVQMSALMKEYKKRGVEMPDTRGKQTNKKWWEFWK